MTITYCSSGLNTPQSRQDNLQNNQHDRGFSWDCQKGKVWTRFGPIVFVSVWMRKEEIPKNKAESSAGLTGTCCVCTHLRNSLHKHGHAAPSCWVAGKCLFLCDETISKHGFLAA